MANKNYGKEFEKIFKKDFMHTFPNEFIFRLKDDTSGYKGSAKNPCDFIAHVGSTLFMLEVKCHYGNTFPFSALRQYNDLLEWGGLNNVERGVIIWMIDHDKVIYAPITTIQQMKADGLKSINVIKNLNTYNIIEFESKKKRVFLETNYIKLVKEG